MKHLLLAIIASLAFAPPLFASETTGTLDTSNVSTGLQFQLACNPASVANGTINATTCAITCNSGFTLSSQSCVAQSTGGGGGGGGGGSATSIFTTTSTGTVTTTATGTTSSGTTIPPTGTIPSGMTTPIGSTPIKVPAIQIPTSRLVFSDIGNNWAKDYIQKLASRKIVNNTEKFRPDDSLSRAEFLKMVGNGAGWTLQSGKTGGFRDVQTGDWYAPYAAYAAEKGIIASVTNFRPNEQITRAEAAKIMSNAFGLATPKVSKSSFSDVSLSNEFISFIEATKLAGVFEGQLKGTKRFFRPNDSITRAEFAKVLVKSLGI